MSLLAAYAVPHPPILLPEIGKGEEQKLAATSAGFLEIARRVAAHRPDTVVLISPHAAAYADYFHVSPGQGAQGSMRAFRAPHVSLRVDYDEAFVQALEKNAQDAGLAAGTMGERDRSLDHGTLIPLYFLPQQEPPYRLVRIGLSGLGALEHYRLGICIAKTAEQMGRNTVLIASGDLSHKLREDGPYGFAPEGPEFDRLMVRALKEGDFLAILACDAALAESAAECGLGSLRIMAGALDGKAVLKTLLSYEGPFGVGYATAAFEVTGADEARCLESVFLRRQQDRLDRIREGEDSYVRLARLGLETFVLTGRRADMPTDLPPELTEGRAGVFVSLKKHGHLRGCIGTISPQTGSVAAEILRNAVSSGCEDPRFSPVSAEELPLLTYSVDVLGKPEAIESESELDVRRYGVIVSHQNRRGLLLPNLEGVSTVRQQVGIARQKAGIPDQCPCRLERFEVVRHQ